MLRWSRWRIVHSAPGSQIVRSASAPTRIVPLRGKSPKMRAGFSDSARAIHDGGSPRLTTPSCQTSGASVSSDGAPKGIGTPCASTKMFVRPGSLNFGSRGAWSLAIVSVRRAQRRADLGEGPELGHLLVAQQQVLRARLRPHALALGLRALDALEPEPCRQVHDVDRTAREPADEDGAVDRLLLGPVGARRGEVRRLRTSLGDRLVLEIAQDVAVLRMDLADAVERGDLLHGLAEELVGDHALAALLVGHEHLEGAHAQAHRLGEAVEDRRLVLEDEVEAEVDDGLALRLFAQSPRGLRQRLARRVIHE